MSITKGNAAAAYQPFLLYIGNNQSSPADWTLQLWRIWIFSLAISVSYDPSFSKGCEALSKPLSFQWPPHQLTCESHVNCLWRFPCRLHNVQTSNLSRSRCILCPLVSLIPEYFNFMFRIFHSFASFLLAVITMNLLIAIWEHCDTAATNTCGRMIRSGYLNHKGGEH